MEIKLRKGKNANTDASHDGHKEYNFAIKCLHANKIDSSDH